MQTNMIFSEIGRRIKLGGHNSEQTVLTVWNDLFRNGYLSWGFNLNNPNPPFFHLTERGEKALVQRSRDPSNPSGYLKYLRESGTANEIALAYVEEGLSCYDTGAHKAAAVMLGAAVETLILELRDTCIEAMQTAGQPVPKKLRDWKLKTVLAALQKIVEENEEQLGEQLVAEYHVHWSAITYQIRTTRNDAGHPSNIDPIEVESVHASYLLLPRLGALTSALSKKIVQIYA